MKKLNRKSRRAAAKAPRWVRDIAAAHFDPQGKRKHREAQLGTFGAASPVRHIDPSELQGRLVSYVALNEPVSWTADDAPVSPPEKERAA